MADSKQPNCLNINDIIDQSRTVLDNNHAMAICMIVNNGFGIVMHNILQNSVLQNN